MVAVIKQESVFEDEWHGCYKGGWSKLIHPESFAHPAKYSRKLIERIYDQVIAEKWIAQGGTVIDPFGGVALGGLDAMRHGLTWIGVELEARFIQLGNQNIALWNEKYSRMPNWGSAVLVQGDSRQLSRVLDKAELIVSSPPYSDGCRQTGGVDPKPHYIQSGNKDVLREYGDAPGQLANLPATEAGHQLAISSPPFITARQNTTRSHSSPGQVGDVVDRQHTANNVYAGESEGQLGSMKEGSLEISISQPYTGGAGINKRGLDRTDGRPNDPISQRTYQSKGGDRSEGNLETMEAGELNDAYVQDHNAHRGRLIENREAALDPSDDEGSALRHARAELGITSPPYEGNEQHSRPSAKDESYFAGRTIGAHGCAEYGNDQDNLGNQRGETFWSASRIILEQLYSVLAPNAHAVFVCKAFVRNKQIVDFPMRWAALCEAVGFKLVHHHRALLVEHSGTQGGFDEDRVLKVERKSFFRRLAEAKGSPRIDHESVLCFERTSAHTEPARLAGTDQLRLNSQASE